MALTSCHAVSTCMVGWVFAIVILESFDEDHMIMISYIYAGTHGLMDIDWMDDAPPNKQLRVHA